MPSLSSLLLKIPDEFKPAAAIGIGSLILVIEVLFHGISLHRILVLFKRAELRLRLGRPHMGRAGLLFGWSIFLMLSLHIVEIVAWAYALVYLGLILRAGDSIYFCANSYTTLGFGTVDLEPQWRNISPIIAISGLFTFAWTTSVLVGIVASYLRLVEQLELERAEELSMREAVRKEEWGVVAREQEAERVQRAETRKQAAGAKFFERRKIWRDERSKEEQMRAATRSETDSLAHKERLAEEQLGQGPTVDDPEARK